MQEVDAKLTVLEELSKSLKSESDAMKGSQEQLKQRFKEMAEALVSLSNKAQVCMCVCVFSCVCVCVCVSVSVSVPMSSIRRVKRKAHRLRFSCHLHTPGSSA